MLIHFLKPNLALEINCCFPGTTRREVYCLIWQQHKAFGICPLLENLAECFLRVYHFLSCISRQSNTPCLKKFSEKRKMLKEKNVFEKILNLSFQDPALLYKVLSNALTKAIS